MSDISENAESLFLKGNECMAAGDAAGAEQCFRRALALSPGFGAALANIGLLRERAGALADAEHYYRQALALLPGSSQLCLNLGVLLLKTKRFAEAEVLNRRAVQLAPASVAAWTNLGVLLACMQRDDEAERCYRRALQLDRDYSRAQYNLGYVLLRRGRFDEGWRCLEARTFYKPLALHFQCARWRGEPLCGKSIVIGFEGGHGDMIQFCRYASLLKQMGAARITLVCGPPLKRLFRTLYGVNEIYGWDEDVPVSGWDFWTPPMSLPRYCETRLDSIPAAIPYLSAEPENRAKWAARLPASGLRIGLVWKGNPQFENDADRSLPSLDLLQPLGAATAAHFISLQKGTGEHEALTPPAGLPLLALGSELQDFADTAAVIAELDLLISIDTAAAHLAGSMGKPCWLLLPDYKADWRWLTGRADSPWYPLGMRLFRQGRGEGWEPVIAEVAAALREFARRP